MQTSKVSSALIGGCAVLTLLLWYYSQGSWSHYYSMAGVSGSSDTRTWTTNSTDQRVGADYYLGGSFVLILAAGWLAMNATKHESEPVLSGGIALGSAGLGAIALGRWYSEFADTPESHVSRYTQSGYILDDAAVFCLGLILALGVTGLVTMVVGRVRQKSSLAASAPES